MRNMERAEPPLPPLSVWVSVCVCVSVRLSLCVGRGAMYLGGERPSLTLRGPKEGKKARKGALVGPERLRMKVYE
jgi:hypothetical protein